MQLSVDDVQLKWVVFEPFDAKLTSTLLSVDYPLQSSPLIMQHRQSFRRNQHVENFQLGRLIKDGHMGEIWCGTQNSTGERAVVKIHDREDTMKFEVEILTKLRGMYSPKFLESGTAQGKFFIAMESFSGNFDEFLDKNDEKEFTCTNVQLIMMQVISGLEFIHKNFIMHGDLTSTHVMFSHPIGVERNVLVKLVGLEKAKKFELIDGKVVATSLEMETVDKKWATAGMLSTEAMKPIDEIYQAIYLLWPMNNLSMDSFKSDDGGFNAKLEMAISPMKSIPRRLRWLASFFTSLDAFDTDAMPSYSKIQKAILTCVRDTNRMSQLQMVDTEGMLHIE